MTEHLLYLDTWNCLLTAFIQSYHHDKTHCTTHLLQDYSEEELSFIKHHLDKCSIHISSISGSEIALVCEKKIKREDYRYLHSFWQGSPHSFRKET